MDFYLVEGAGKFSWVQMIGYLIQNFEVNGHIHH